MKKLPISAENPDHYSIIRICGENYNDQIHIIPEYLKIGLQSQRIYNAYRGYGGTKLLRLKNQGPKKADYIMHNKNIDQDLILHTFSYEGVRNFYLQRISLRSYKNNPLILFRNTQYFYGIFKIISEFFKSLDMNFRSNVQRIHLATNRGFYDLLSSLRIFSEVSLMTIPLIILLTR